MLSPNELKAMQWLVQSARVKNSDEKMEAMGDAAWFIKQETDAVIAREVKTV